MWWQAKTLPLQGGRVPLFRRQGSGTRGVSASAASHGRSKDGQKRSKGGADVVLSSGFLAFASHSGFLAAVEEAGMTVRGVMGTSAGALAGSLYCAGYSPREVADQLSRQPPIALLRPSFEPWRGGVLSLDGVVERLRELLPPTFEDLPTEFAVGVVSSVDGKHILIDSGPLPEAVAASAAVPTLFQAVDIPGYRPLNLLSPFKDGGCVDRVGLSAWRERRRRQALEQGRHAPHQLPPALVHVITRSSPLSGFDGVVSKPDEGIHVVRSPKSGVSLLSLGDFEEHLQACRERVLPQLLEISDGVPLDSSSSSSSSSSKGVSGSRGLVGTAASAGAASEVQQPRKRLAGSGSRV